MSGWKKAMDKPAKDEAKAIQKEADLILASLEHARHGTKREPLYVAPAQAPKGEFTRVIIPDSHGNKISRHAAAAFLADLKRINPKEIVMLGDHLDCGGFLAQHHAMGYVAECDDSYEDDVAATNEFLDQIQKNAPSARIHYIEGNHEQRVEKWCVTMALRNKRDASMLLKAFGPIDVLKLNERGVGYYRTSGRYHGVAVPGTIKLGKCYFTHGFGFGRNATMDHVCRAAGNIVHGHTHRSQSAVIRTIGTGVISGYCPGTLAQLQPMYAHNRCTDWSHGYAIQVVDTRGGFHHINIPIQNGRSAMPSLIKTMA
jgi:predicted phosphodiesterase